MSYETQPTGAEFTASFAHRQYNSDYQQHYSQGIQDAGHPIQEPAMYMHQNTSNGNMPTMDHAAVMNNMIANGSSSNIDMIVPHQQPMYGVSYNQSYESINSYAENIPSEDIYNSLTSQIPDEQIVAGLQRHYDQIRHNSIQSAGHSGPVADQPVIREEDEREAEPITLENLLEDDPLLSFTTTLDRQRSNDTIIEVSSPINPPSEPSPMSHLPNGQPPSMMTNGNASAVSLAEEPSSQNMKPQNIVQNTLPTPANSTISGNHSSPNLLQPNYTVAPQPPQQHRPPQAAMQHQLQFSPPKEFITVVGPNTHPQQPQPQPLPQLQQRPLPHQQPPQQQKRQQAVLPMEASQHQFQATTQMRMHQAMIAQQQQQQQYQRVQAQAAQAAQANSIAQQQAQVQAQQHLARMQQQAAQAAQAAQAQAHAHAAQQQAQAQAQAHAQAQAQAQAHAQAQAQVQARMSAMAPQQYQPQQHVFLVQHNGQMVQQTPAQRPQRQQQISPPRHPGMNTSPVAQQQPSPFPGVQQHSPHVPMTPPSSQPPMIRSSSTTKLTRPKKSSLSSGSSSSTKSSHPLKKSKSFVTPPVISKTSKQPLYQTLDFSKSIMTRPGKQSDKMGKTPTKINVVKNYEFVFEQGDGRMSIPRRRSVSSTPTSAKFSFAKPPPIDGGAYSPKTSPTNSEASGQSPLTMNGSFVTQPSPIPSSIQRFSPNDSTGLASPTAESFAFKKKRSVCSPGKTSTTPPSSLRDMQSGMVEFQVKPQK